MKKILLIITITLLSMPAYSQDNWLDIGKLDSKTELFVNIDFKKTDDGYYKTWVKFKLVNNIQNERAKMAKELKNDKYLKYSYTIFLYVVDVSQHRYQVTSTISYNDDGEVIYNHNVPFYNGINWEDPVPGTVSDGIVSAIEKAVNGNK